MSVDYNTFCFTVIIITSIWEEGIRVLSIKYEIQRLITPIKTLCYKYFQCQRRVISFETCQSENIFTWLYNLAKKILANCDYSRRICRQAIVNSFRNWNKISAVTNLKMVERCKHLWHDGSEHWARTPFNKEWKSSPIVWPMPHLWRWLRGKVEWWQYN